MSSKPVAVGVCYTKLKPDAIKASDAFVEGIVRSNDIPIIIQVKDDANSLLKKCDISVQVAEAIVPSSPNFITPELKLRLKILNWAEINNKNRIIVDTGFIKNKRLDLHNMDRYFSISVNGIKRKSIFFNKDSPNDRFLKINTKYSEWKIENSDGLILILGQNPLGISSQGLDLDYWFNNTISKIKQIYNNQIVILRHPNQFKKPKILYNDIHMYKVDDVQEFFEQAFFSVCRATNLSIDSILAGVPLYTEDEKCMAYDMASRSIDKRVYPDRQQWLNDLCYAQWHLEEIRSGECWRHFKRNLFPC